ncbi:hypothetical protein FC27_GL002002 [Companilactobacillus versmoldensis DSM 14857 = KCTC 3814]|uniref:Zinc-ribbon domain-containing protein n=2 Tax=Companilactobacillus versmoldensis TaxID=194326 RepID=A0A0R1SMM0_9LACO|nr:hypothetical protein FC27_GL002002 [Companilactobacillus versmoldensis DSM 14857 = KCTC 3814]
MQMVCPNCGHEISPNQNFCENCGLPLKKNIQSESTESKEAVKPNDSVRSLADIEKELDEQEDKPAQDQKKQPAEDEDDIDDKTRVYDFRKELKQNSEQPKSNEHHPLTDSEIQMAPAQQKELENQAHLNNHPKAPDNLNLDSPVHIDPVTHLPVYPDDKIKNDKSDDKEQEDENDGLLSNMINFLKHNVYVDIVAVILVILLFFIKRNYSWILLAIFLVAWFLTSQIVHGKEIRLNKLFTRKKKPAEEPAQNNQNNNYQPNQYQQNQYQQNQYQQNQYQQPNPAVQNPYNQYNTQRQQPQQQASGRDNKQHEHAGSTKKRIWSQKFIMLLAIVAFLASITGPFVNGVSLSSTIANAASYTANFGAQTTLIMNASSAIRFICFISPVIVLIAANFRSRGSIRWMRIFSVLPSIIYIITYGLFASNIFNASVITGQYVTGNVQIGTSFYVLIATSVLSLLLTYTLKPRLKN